MTERVQDGFDGEAVDFLARLGTALIAANDAIGLVRQTLTLACSRYGLSNGFLLLPTYVQFVGFDRAAGTIVRVVSVDRELRFDQTFILAELVERVEQGKIGAKDGAAELDRIHRKRPRFPAWVSVIGYATETAGLALILQPTPLALMAATIFGLLVGTLGLGRVPRISDRGLRAQMAPGCVVGRLEYARYESRPPPCREPSGSRSPSPVIRGTRPDMEAVLSRGVGKRCPWPSPWAPLRSPDATLGG